MSGRRGVRQRYLRFAEEEEEGREKGRDDGGDDDYDERVVVGQQTGLGDGFPRYLGLALVGYVVVLGAGQKPGHYSPGDNGLRQQRLLYCLRINSN